MKCCVKERSRAARFRQDAVTLFRQSDSLQASGQPVSTPVAFAHSVGCLVRDTRGTEFKNGDGLDATVDFVIEMRYRVDIDPTCEAEVTRGKHKGKTLNVTAVLFKPDEGSPKETHLYCKFNATPNG